VNRPFAQQPFTPRPRARAAAFTLIELIVTVSVIAVLLSITLPAVSGSRRAAARAMCLHRLGGIGVAASAYSHDHQGTLPTMFSGPSPAMKTIENWGWNDHAALPADQIILWCYMLGPYLDAENLLRQAEAVSCPDVFHDMSVTTPSPERVVVPAYAVASYNYSVSCFTSPSAWRDASTGPDVNLAHQANQWSSVRHPSAKTLLVEFASRHDSVPERLWESRSGVFNVLAADAHAEPISALRSRDPVPFRGRSVDSYNYFPWTEHPVPLFASRGGIHGTDWRP